MTARRDIAEYLQDVLSMLDDVTEFTRSMTFEKFAADRKTQLAVVHAIEVIGEASKQLPADVRRRHPGIPWRQMAGMRDRLIHGYFAVDLRITWDTAITAVPALWPLIEAALEEEQRG